MLCPSRVVPRVVPVQFLTVPCCGGLSHVVAALVPAYIDHVPRAKYTIFFAEFTYQSRPGMTTLAYMDLPPFGRPSYDFDNRNWYYLD